MNDEHEDCVTEEVESSITMTFNVCRTHGRSDPIGGTIEANSVGLNAITDVALDAIIHALSMVVGDYPALLSLVTTDYDDGHGPLPERAHKHLARLLAHEYLMRKMRTRGYATGRMESALMTLPRGLFD